MTTGKPCGDSQGCREAQRPCNERLGSFSLSGVVWLPPSRRRATALESAPDIRHKKPTGFTVVGTALRRSFETPSASVRHCVSAHQCEELASGSHVADCIPRSCSPGKRSAPGAAFLAHQQKAPGCAPLTRATNAYGSPATLMPGVATSPPQSSGRAPLRTYR